MSMEDVDFKMTLGDTKVNCSVYALPAGYLTFEALNNGSWSSNVSTEFLAAYFLTNCSTKDLSNIISNTNFTEIAGYKSDNPIYQVYKDENSGHAFIALLFTASGACASAWMLTLLLYLSPRHKRKSWLAQLATIIYAIAFTIILFKLTKISEVEYYEGTLNVIRLTNYMYDNTENKVFLPLAQIITNLAWLEIVEYTTRPRFKLITGIIGLCIIIVNAAFHILIRCDYSSEYDIGSSGEKSRYRRMQIVETVFQIVIDIWFLASLFYYTIISTNPRRISYSKKLLPIALFNIFLILVHIVVNFLYITLFSNNWPAMKWLQLIPKLVEILLVTTIWEWISNINVLEKRFEMMGVLGRRLSIDDVLTSQFHGTSLPGSSRSWRRVTGLSFLHEWASNRRKKMEAKDVSDSVINKMSSSESLKDILEGATVAQMSSNTLQRASDLTSETDQSLGNSSGDTGDLVGAQNQSAGLGGLAGLAGLDLSTEEQIVIDNYDIESLNHEDEVLSQGVSEQQPPPFNAHRGFNLHDYWHDEKI
ncbi:uncharacterized protein PRCAT00001325001 [Priceomyces carsonii]|uniref:uncharacterized protein n=1 Tax=Priceomyces carsonii TaxID=28549 RepID=UPI002EDAECCF|nr:unnamed protein product [Priceomyces carsonii]